MKPPTIAPYGRPDNLYEPIPDEAATHGMFDSHARARSHQLWANTHRPLLAGAVVCLASAAAGLIRMDR